MFLLFATFLGADEGPPPEEPEVLQWVRGAQRGERRAAERLYRAYARRVFRAVRPLCVSDAQAEDAVQDAFVRALDTLNRFAPRPGHRFVGWLLTVALNVTRTQVLRAQRVRPTEKKDLESAADRGAADPGAPLDKAALLKALATLSERDREVVCLRYGAELSSAEVGEALGLSEANVRKICERQREHLLGLLGGTP